MKLPFVSRKRYDNERGRTIVYVPAEYPTLSNGKPAQIPSDDYAFHDSRIGWVRRKEFKTYADYEAFLKQSKSTT